MSAVLLFYFWSEAVHKFFSILHFCLLENKSNFDEWFKADMKSYIPLETAAIYFLANLFLKQGISSGYVMVDFIYMG